MHDILQFHRLHGTAVVLSEGGAVATRCGDFCNGLAFSNQPIKVGQKVCLELTQSAEWSGALRLGVTFHDPSKLNQKDLPRYACPDLTNKEGYWARGLNEKYADTGNHITFYVNGSGQLHYFVNNEHKGMLLNHLPTTKRLWALFDIYGNTSAAKLVHAGTNTSYTYSTLKISILCQNLINLSISSVEIGNAVCLMFVCVYMS